MDLKITQFPSEYVNLIANTVYGGDRSKVPTAHEQGVEYGTLLVSRYRKAYEYKAMARIVDAMPKRSLVYIRRIECDSQMGQFYSFDLMVAGALNFDRVCADIHAALRNGTDGFNGADVESEVHGRRHIPGWGPECAEERAWVAFLVQYSGDDGSIIQRSVSEPPFDDDHIDYDALPF